MPTRIMNKGAGENGGFVHGMPCIDEIYSENQRFFMGKNVVFKDDEDNKGLRKKSGFFKNVCCSNESSSSSSSSIGKNSDLSENSLEKSTGDDCEEEVQSSYKGPLDAMEDLEQVLPIRRGISKFYNGKSKSFASLGDASSSSSIKEIAKPDNALARKRRNLLACNLGGISKRVTNSSRTTLALAVAMNNCEKSGTLSASLSKNNFSSWRSYSLADLQQHCVSSVGNSNQPATNRPS